ncbi:MAG TPA: LTA synthase family protein [Candidatus Paceibacterota bacterium]
MRRRVRQYLLAHWLPFALIVLFVLQNYLFDVWLKIYPNTNLGSLIAGSAGLAIILFAPALLFRKRTGYVYLGIASIVAALIFVSQYLYYAYSGGFLQASSLFYAGQGTDEIATIITLLNYNLLLFVLGPVLVLVHWVVCRRNRTEVVKLSRKKKVVIGIIIVLIAALCYGYVFGKERIQNGSDTQLYNYNRVYDVNQLVSKIGIVNFYIGDIITAIAENNQITPADVAFVQSWVKQKPPMPPPGSDFGIAKGRNLIFIQVESLENAVINTKINGQEITPNLNALASEGLYFPNYYSEVGPGTTADAEFTTLNSLYALPDQVAFISYPDDTCSALPSLLKNNGYSTCSLHGDVASFWNRANIYPNLGYQQWFSRPDFAIPRDIGAFDLGDEDFFDQAAPKLESFPQPFMATLITLSSHTPFQIPADLETLNIPSSTNLTWIQYQYLESVHYTDQAIGNFINELKQDGLYNNSLIVIYGDHSSYTDIASALGVNNTPFSNFSLQNTQVPLIILEPGSSTLPNKIDETPGSHLDLYPTVADMLGVAPPSTVLGQDLLTTKTPVVVARNLVSGTVNTILTNDLAYQASPDGIYADGTCITLPSKAPLPVTACAALYNDESSTVKASDLMIEGNMIGGIVHTSP